MCGEIQVAKIIRRESMAELSDRVTRLLSVVQSGLTYAWFASPYRRKQLVHSYVEETTLQSGEVICPYTQEVVVLAVIIFILVSILNTKFQHN